MRERGRGLSLDDAYLNALARDPAALDWLRQRQPRQYGGPLAVILGGLALAGFTTPYAWIIVAVGIVGWPVYAWYRRGHLDQAERDRRRRIIDGLRAAYRAEYMTAKGDGIPHDVMMGTMHVPSEWLNQRLRAMGERWQVS